MTRYVELRCGKCECLLVCVDMGMAKRKETKQLPEGGTVVGVRPLALYECPRCGIEIQELGQPLWMQEEVLERIASTWPASIVLDTL